MTEHEIEQNKDAREAHLLYGVLAEFATPEALLAAVHQTRDEGYRSIETYTPWPLEGLTEAMALHKSYVLPLALFGGIFGGVGGYSLQYFASVWSYPWNVGGRPFHSWPAFVPVTFELTILFSSLVIFASVFILNGLPRPYQPVFNVPEFARASSDRFFLCVAADDPKFDAAATRDFLRGLHADGIHEVER